MFRTGDNNARPRNERENPIVERGPHGSVDQGTRMGVVRRAALDARLQLHARELRQPRGPVAGARRGGALCGDGPRARRRGVHRFQHASAPRRAPGLRRVARRPRRLHGALRADACRHGLPQDARDHSPRQRLHAPEVDLEAPEARAAVFRPRLPRRPQAQPARQLPRRNRFFAGRRPGAEAEILRDVRGASAEVPRGRASGTSPAIPAAAKRA